MLIPNAFEGTVDGIIVVVVQLLGERIFHLNNLYLILCLFSFIVVRNWTVFLFSIFIPLITYWIIYNKFIDTYLLILLSNIALLFLLEIWRKIVFKKYSMKIYLIPSSIIALVVGIMFSKFILNNHVWNLNIFNYIVPLLFAFIFFIIYNYLLSFWLSANSLIDVNLYDFDNFYRIKSSEKAMGLFLKNNRTENGVFLIFSFAEFPFYKSSFNKESILQKVEKEFQKYNALFFKISKEEYAVFFSISSIPNIASSIIGNSLNTRDKSDFLREVEKSIHNLNKDIDFEFQFGCSIYGVQVFGFNNALRKAKFAMNSSRITGKNILSLFNPIYYNKYKSDVMSIKELNKNMLIKNVYTTFQLSVNKKGVQQQVYYSKPHVSSFDNLDTNEILQYSKTIGTYDILTRYLAAESIKNFDHSKQRNLKILFKYSPSLIANENFNTFVFMNIIKSHNISTSNIIMYFDLREILKYSNSLLFQSNMNILRKNHIKIGVSNISINDNNNNKFLKALMPDYICIDKIYFESKKQSIELEKIINISKILKSKTIAFDISSKNELKNIIIHDINIIGGKYIQKSSLTPKILTLEENEIIKRKIYAK